jgi:hypothetical protein
MSAKGLPGVQQMNFLRTHLYEVTHDDKARSKTKRAFGFLGHKALSVILIPTNILTIGLGIAGMAASACTLGALKVAIFAVTGKKDLFSTGFLRCAEISVFSFAHVCANSAELFIEGALAVKKCAKAVHGVVKKMGMEQVVKRALHAVIDAYAKASAFVEKRIGKGFKKAAEAEGKFKFTMNTPFFLRPINDLAKQNRIQPNAQDRPLSTILKHTFYSIPNIALNGTTAVCAIVATAVLGIAFIGKAALYATTNIDVSIPTYVGPVSEAAITTAGNAIVDTATDIADGFVLLFKASKALGINKLVAKASHVIAYIPRAIFS